MTRYRNSRTGTVVTVGPNQSLPGVWVPVDKPSKAPQHEAKPDTPPSLPEDRDALLAIADAEGIDVDRRLGAARLTEAIEQARGS